MITYKDEFIDSSLLSELLRIYNFIDEEDYWFDTGPGRDVGVFHFNNFLRLCKSKDDYSILIKTLKKIKQELLVTAQINKAIYADSYMAAKWVVGDKQYPHSDSHRNNGHPNETWWRKYSTVLYLNDDCSGGNTYFPDHDLTIEPKKGRLALFDAGLEYKHGVSEVTSGVRKNLIAFWGYEKEVCEYRI